MIRTRASALAFATTFIGTTLASGMWATPIANAAPLDAVRSAVVGIRSGAACGALNYNIDLEGEAQALIGNGLSTSKPGNYKGDFVTRRGLGDPQDEAIDDLIAKSLNAIKNCSYVDFGVGFYRPNLEDGPDYVSIALGQGPPKPAEAPKPPVETPAAVQPVPCPAGSKTESVIPPATCEAIPAPDANSVSMSATKSGGKVNVSFKNSANILANCQYTAAPDSNPLGVLPTINKSVRVDAKGSGALNGEPGPPPFITYNLSANCTGIFNGSEVPLGSPTTSVSG